MEFLYTKPILIRDASNRLGKGTEFYITFSNIIEKVKNEKVFFTSDIIDTDRLKIMKKTKMKNDSKSSTVIIGGEQSSITINDSSSKVKNNDEQSSITIDNSSPSVIVGNEQSSIKNVSPSSVSTIDCFQFVNLHLFPMTTINELKYILAFLFELNISHINIQFVESLTNKHSFRYESLYSQKNANLEIFNNCISIGYNTIEVEILSHEDNVLNNYESQFLRNYTVLKQYVSKLKSNSPIISPKISYINLSLIYNSNVHPSIDICRLFNLSPASKYSKVYINSKKVDDVYDSEREMQYVKTTTSSANIFKGVESIYESCVFYVGTEVGNGLILNSIAICENMTIDLTFINFDISVSYDDLMIRLKQFISKKLMKIIKDTNIDECIYDSKFSYSNYVPVLTGLTASITISKGTIQDIGSTGNILLQKVPTIRFPTKTSIQFNTYCFRSIASLYRLLYLLESQDYLTENIIQKWILPIAHVGLSDGLTITISNAVNYQNLIFNFLYIIKNLENYSLNSEEKTTELTYNNIRKRALKYDKKTLLGVLLATDPRLFGSRNINGVDRPYSGLAQKENQRVIPLTHEEYKIVKKKAPGSVVNLQNQTFQNQRLYLYCPWSDTKYVNFHIYPNQLCIVKCTTKLSNRSQINYCVEELNVVDMLDLKYRYENQTVTLYNPLINKGRKCKLPTEISQSFYGYVLQKLPIDIHDLELHCLAKFESHPFVIQRNPNEFNYIIFSEIDETKNYVLIMQSELNNDSFVFLDESTGKPLLFSNNATVKSFFLENIQKTKNQTDFFNYIRKLLKINIDDIYNKTANVLMEELHVKHGIRFGGVSSFVYCIIYNSKVYIVPKFYIKAFRPEEKLFMLLPNVLDLILMRHLHFPPLSDFDINDVTMVYRNYTSKMITAIQYNGVVCFISRVENLPPKVKIPIVIFDSRESLNRLFELDQREETGIKTQLLGSVIELINLLIFAFIMETRTREINNKEFIAYIKKLGVVDKQTKLVFTNEIVSWRQSKLSLIDLKNNEHVYVNTNIEELIYNQLQRNIRFSHINGEYINKKIITS
ncbi:MAG: hypothetical protein WC939_05020 [Acholeplasmataceae bacterium]